MKEYEYLDELISRYPVLAPVKADIRTAYEMLKECYERGGKLLIAFAGILLPLAVFAVVVLLIVWICVGASRRSKKRRMRKMQQTMQAQQQPKTDADA